MSFSLNFILDGLEWLLFSSSVVWSAHVLISSSRTWRSGRTTCCLQDSLGKTTSEEYFGHFACWLSGLLIYFWRCQFFVALKSVKLRKMGFVVNRAVSVSAEWSVLKHQKRQQFQCDLWCLTWDSFSGCCQQCNGAPVYQSHMYNSGC